MSDVKNDKAVRLAKAKFGHMIMTKTLNLLPLEKATTIAEHFHEYKNLSVQGPGISDFDQVTLGYLANRMFSEQTLVFSITTNDILDFHQIHAEKRYEHRKRVILSIENLWETSFSFERKNLLHECRVINSMTRPVESKDFYIIELNQSFASIFEYDNFCYTLHPYAYKSIFSTEARKLYRVLMNFRFTQSRVYSLHANVIAYSLGYTGKAPFRRNDAIKRAFDSLIKEDLVESYEVQGSGAKAVFKYVLSKNFSKFSEEKVAEKAEMKIKKESEKAISQKVSKISDSFSMRHLENYVPDAFFSDELFDTNEGPVRKAEELFEKDSYDWVSELAWQGQLKAQWSAAK